MCCCTGRKRTADDNSKIVIRGKQSFGRSGDLDTGQRKGIKNAFSEEKLEQHSDNNNSLEKSTAGEICHHLTTVECFGSP